MQCGPPNESIYEFDNNYQIHLFVPLMISLFSVCRGRIPFVIRHFSRGVIRDALLPCESVVELSCEVYKHRGDVNYDQQRSPPMMMLHGLFGSKLNYRTVGRKISQLAKLEVKGLDFRNHGSSPHAIPLSYNALAGDVIHHIERHEDIDAIKRNDGLILLGHLMGAKVAMLIALQRPDLVSKLIVVDNSPIKQDLEAFVRPKLEGMCEIERELEGTKAPNSAMWPRITLILSKYVEDERERFFLMSNLDVKGKVTASKPRRFRIPVLEFLQNDLALNVGDWPLNRQPSKPKFHKPVLIMKAKHSDFIDERGLKEFSNYFTQLKVDTFDTNHWIVANQPEEFVRSVVAFIEDKE